MTGYNTATSTAWAFNHDKPLDEYEPIELALLCYESFETHHRYISELRVAGKWDELIEVLLDPFDTMDEQLEEGA